MEGRSILKYGSGAPSSNLSIFRKSGLWPVSCSHPRTCDARWTWIQSETHPGLSNPLLSSPLSRSLAPKRNDQQSLLLWRETKVKAGISARVFISSFLLTLQGITLCRSRGRGQFFFIALSCEFQTLLPRLGSPVGDSSSRTHMSLDSTYYWQGERLLLLDNHSYKLVHFESQHLPDLQKRIWLFPFVTLIVSSMSTFARIEPLIMRQIVTEVMVVGMGHHLPCS